MTQPVSRRRRNVDLAIPRRPAVGAADSETVTGLYEWAEGLAYDAIGWYLAEKKRKARWSRRLRGLSAILATLGGAVPVAALASGRPVLGNWGFVLLAMAAGCLAYDRFFGYSSSWLRYMSTAMVLRAQLSDFQLSWIELTAGQDRPTAELIDFVHAFVRVVNDTIRGETESWLFEFNSQFAKLEANVANAHSSTDLGKIK